MARRRAWLIRDISLHPRSWSKLTAGAVPLLDWTPQNVAGVVALYFL